MRPTLLSRHALNLLIHLREEIVGVIFTFCSSPSPTDDSTDHLFLQGRPLRPHLVQRRACRSKSGEQLFEGLNDAVLFGERGNRDLDSFQNPLIHLVNSSSCASGPLDLRPHQPRIPNEAQICGSDTSIIHANTDHRVRESHLTPDIPDKPTAPHEMKRSVPSRDKEVARLNEVGERILAPPSAFFCLIEIRTPATNGGQPQYRKSARHRLD